MLGHHLIEFEIELLLKINNNTYISLFYDHENIHRAQALKYTTVQ